MMTSRLRSGLARFALSISLLFGLVACGYGNDDPDDPDEGLPITIPDDEDPEVDPSVDLRSCDAAASAEGDTWVSCDVEGSWTPADTLYSWFVHTVILDSSGGMLGDCTFQRHDGVESTFCEPTSYEGLTVTHGADGFLVVFDGIDAPEGGTLTVDTGVLPLAGGTFASDQLTGSFGADKVPVPGTP